VVVTKPVILRGKTAGAWLYARELPLAIPAALFLSRRAGAQGAVHDFVKAKSLPARASWIAAESPVFLSA
jgi:hypothetical protein